jgi:hypothetical protein
MHNYVILSPGRCGSVFLGKYLLSQIGTRDEIFYDFKHVEDDTDIEYSSSKCIIHIHNLNKLASYRSDNDYLIVIRRNPIEIAASMMLADITGAYHFNNIYREDYILKYKDSIFEFDPTFFFNEVKRFSDWYVKADKLKSNLILNFNQAINPKYIDQKFNFKEVNLKEIKVPLAQPFNKWDKIKDADNLRNIGYKLFKAYKKQYPEIFNSDDFNY